MATTAKAGARKSSPERSAESNPPSSSISDSPQTNLPFETALKRLETIVEAMEDGEMPLEKLLEKYEEGAALVRTCQAKLDEAELKIRKLEADASGALAARPLDGDDEDTARED